MTRARLTVLLLGALWLLIGNCSGVKEVKLTVPSSTQLKVTLTTAIQTEKNQTGDQFTGQLSEPVETEGKIAIPAGAQVNLVITKLVRGGTLKTPPEIAFTVKNIILQDGKAYSLATNEIYRKGESHTKREAEMIGGGAAAGAVVGGIIGKGKGAVVGAVAGAAAGTGAAAATGRQNLEFAPGQSVTFTLMQPFTVTILQKR